MNAPGSAPGSGPAPGQQPNRFEDFFADGSYIALKNHLYNYRLRRRAVNRCLRGRGEERILEVGSGLSPVVKAPGRVVYSELSFQALKALRQILPGGLFVAADAGHLPFKPGAFGQVVCSEVLEHLPDDRRAIAEMAGVLRRGGELVMTFPHRQGYFALDDRFVNHLRRYELPEMEVRLREAGLEPVEVRKVLGPLEKATMILAVWAARRLGRGKPQAGEGEPQAPPCPRRGPWKVAAPSAPTWARSFLSLRHPANGRGCSPARVTRLAAYPAKPAGVSNPRRLRRRPSTSIRTSFPRHGARSTSSCCTGRFELISAKLA